ncbi:cell wall-binding repeat-containing protein [Clostridium tertium]|uniref:cell wall-binding repeat-containing protein n=1 Tax=Clostridium tertium TaxID=1559 RepID=UPI000DCF6FC3|nr:cell wall-binding repeat-containing protein [Clostridium tertium]
MKNKFLKILLSTAIVLGSISFRVQALELNYIEGIDRYETASMIASNMDYSNAILVNGLSIADGLSASGLSGTLNAPILLTRDSSIPNSTLEKLKLANNIYIVGGDTVISPNIESQISKMGKSVKRLAGSNRYDTSIAVANEIEKIKGIQEIYYVNGLKGEADAMSIAPVASFNQNPVILTNGQSTNYKKSVKSYSIGGTTVLDSSFDNFSERISGLNRFETNKNVINKFFPNKTHVNLSKSDILIDALTASALKEPVVLISNDSDKSVIAGSKSATVFGNINPTAVNRAKAYLYGDAVVFYSQHQDDETLFAGSAIVDAIESVGKENVYIVLVTDGTGSEVFNWDRYRNISNETKIALRTAEFKEAVLKLGVKSENIILLNQPESNIDKNIIVNTIDYFENNFNNVTHVTHSYKYDTHPQHLETGRIVNNLYENGLIKDCRFFAPSTEINNIPKTELIESVADNTIEKNSVLNACKEYELDNKDMIREGIGYKSVPGLFRNLTSDPKVSSYLHTSGV